MRGRLLVRQLTGRAPIVVDGVPIGGNAVAARRWLELGDTRLAVGRWSDGAPGGGATGVTSGDVLGIDLTSGTAVVLPAAERLGIAADPTHPDHGAMAAAVGAAAAPCTKVVVAASGSRVLDTCTTLVELGTRWRARLTPDCRDPLTILRVHLRHGASEARSVMFTGAPGGRR